jgi:hypothetical protein
MRPSSAAMPGSFRRQPSDRNSWGGSLTPGAERRKGAGSLAFGLRQTALAAPRISEDSEQ